MTYDAIRKAAKAQPFEPFFVRFADGHKLHVRHPEMIFVPGEPARGFVLHEDGGFQVVDLMLVSALEFQYEPREERRAG